MPMSFSLYGLPQAMNGGTDCEVAGPLEGVDAGIKPGRTPGCAGGIRQWRARWVWTYAMTAKIYWVLNGSLPPRCRGVTAWQPRLCCGVDDAGCWWRFDRRRNPHGFKR